MSRAIRNLLTGSLRRATSDLRCATHQRVVDTQARRRCRSASMPKGQSSARWSNRKEQADARGSHDTNQSSLKCEISSSRLGLAQIAGVESRIQMTKIDPAPQGISPFAPGAPLVAPPGEALRCMSTCDRDVLRDSGFCAESPRWGVQWDE